jgi:hypothetical protein
MSKEVDEFVEIVEGLVKGLAEVGLVVPGTTIPSESITSLAQSVYKYRHEQPRGGFGGKGGGKQAPKEVKEVKGEVEQAYEKDGRHAFKVQGQWYSTFDGEVVKDIEEGNSVIFGVEKKGQFWNIITASVTPF